jgi:diadenosine tetraphosphate (Ap4A) HIT family hydrolase
MIYQKFLNKINKKNLCPFCKINRQFIIIENKSAYMTPARAPYVKNHLLIIPKKHVTQFHDLRSNEKSDLFDLMIFGLDFLKKKYAGVEIIYKEGELASAHKSIDHSHIHLIPKRTIHKKPKVDERDFLTEKQLLKRIKEIKKLIKNDFKN